MSHILYRIEEDGPTLHTAGKPARSARWILAAAEAGELEAQALLGQILLDGHGIQRDPVLARSWFAIAARGGHVMASNMLGRCLELGWGGDPDLPAAARCYRQAAERSLDWGMYNYANLLATGRGVERDQVQALAWYRRAAEHGHAKSMNLVGRYYEEGRTVPRDAQAAFAWYRRSAEAGDFRGQFSYASMLAEQARWEEARHWLLQALTLGHLRFLQRACDELQKASIAPLADIVRAYARRCAELESALPSSGPAEAGG